MVTTIVVLVIVLAWAVCIGYLLGHFVNFSSPEDEGEDKNSYVIDKDHEWPT
jgi:hypothetical protein